MKKYYVIKLAFDDGFWSEEHQDFKGWLYATKYSCEPDWSKMEQGIVYFEEQAAIANMGEEFKKAAQKKPITILEVYDHE